jgi:hypothetical protein
LSRVRLQELILTNWPAKILSVGCAIVLFVFYRTSTLEERFFSVPLLIEGVANMVPANRYPTMVRVTLRGNANSIYPVINSDIETFIDLGGATEKGTRHFPVQVRKKGTALGVEALEIAVDPMEITVELDAKFSTYVNISPNIQGDPATGFELTQTSLNPSRIRIEGPEGLIRRYTELMTEIIDLEGRNTDFTIITRVANSDQLIMLHGESIIEFRGEVRPIMTIKNFDNVSVGVKNLNGRLRLAVPPEFGQLRLDGPKNELDLWVPDENALFVDCKDITAPGEYDLPLQVSLPASFRLLGTAAEATALATLNRTGLENAERTLDGAPVIHVTIVRADNSGG